jgi:AraC-like DNA-binding protein
MSTTNRRRIALEMRIEKACRLMVETEMSMAEIALEAGFSSQSHMNFAMRRLKGITPVQCRRRCLALPARKPLSKFVVFPAFVVTENLWFLNGVTAVVA